jgi:hypothetical protein
MELRDCVTLFCVFGIGFGAVLFGGPLLDKIVEGMNNFRGGPPTPMHPSPSNDAALLRQRLKTIRSERV